MAATSGMVESKQVCYCTDYVSSVASESDSDVSDGTTSANDCFTPKGRGKKRKSDPNNWVRNIAKRARNSGTEYVSVATGKKVKKKVFRKVDKCCKKR